MVWLKDALEDLHIRGTLPESDKNLFPSELLSLLLILSRHTESWRQELLSERKAQMARYRAGHLPEYLQEHPAHQSSWKVARLPSDLLDRRVEITGPVSSTKMVINMLNPGPDGIAANTAMLDFEDSMAPTWENVKSGIRNLVGIANQTLEFQDYRILNPGQVLPMVRVRGLHLNETSIIVDGSPISAGLFDLVCSAYHTSKKFISKGITPKFYVPKTESYQEARWWNQLFLKLEEALGLESGTLKVTFLIETLPAAFQMEEILWEVRERACGLNVGRWDKIFSDIKVLGKNKDCIMADRACIDMSRSWMENYAKRLIKICHKHGALAIGGMAAFTPGQDPKVREIQSNKVALDKKRESELGHDGCWVSHPYFISIAMKQFKATNQLDRLLPEFSEQPNLIPRFEGKRTLAGLRTNIRVGIAYVEGWNRGLGCISIDGLMEDLATLEISRAQVWQWLYHGVRLDDKILVTKDLIIQIFEEETERLLSEKSESMESLEEYKVTCAKFLQASRQCQNLFLETELPDFFTTYWEGQHHVNDGNRKKLGDQRQMEGHSA